MDIVNILWLLALAYLLAQLYAVIWWRGWWRIAALAPLLVMIPVIITTVVAYQKQSNLWPLLLMFASPVALLVLILLGVAQLIIRRRQKTL